jgi:hypothetical protein
LTRVICKLCSDVNDNMKNNLHKMMSECNF